MLHIFYGRENKNKDQFLFDSIKGRTLLLVPDQFTLQAERDAFFYLGTKGLMDLEVVSISRLGMKVLAETGGGRCPMIDKYGRHMLLTKILREKKESDPRLICILQPICCSSDISAGSFIKE